MIVVKLKLTDTENGYFFSRVVCELDGTAENLREIHDPNVNREIATALRRLAYEYEADAR